MVFPDLILNLKVYKMTTATTAKHKAKTPTRAKTATSAKPSRPAADKIEKDSILMAYSKRFMVKKFHHRILAVIFVK